MRVLIKTFSARGASIADEDGRIITGGDCREIVEAMRLPAPFTGCADLESYMRWTLRSIKGAGGAAPKIEGDTPEARTESLSIDWNSAHPTSLRKGMWRGTCCHFRAALFTHGAFLL